jgi:hypothetical protein
MWGGIEAKWKTVKERKMCLTIASETEDKRRKGACGLCRPGMATNVGTVTSERETPD